jgi:predicted RNA binding protein YcfA (HicA-like mRNA interferase family)
VAKLPTDVSGERLRRALERAGFVFSRQRGGHMIMRRENPPARVVVPNHKVIRPGTLKQILEAAAISSDELRLLL